MRIGKALANVLAVDRSYMLPRRNGKLTVRDGADWLTKSRNPRFNLGSEFEVRSQKRTLLKEKETKYNGQIPVHFCTILCRIFLRNSLAEPPKPRAAALRLDLLVACLLRTCMWAQDA